MFRDLDFTLLEMNPFTLDSAGLPFPLDMRGELDDTAAFKSGKKWGPIEFPLPFGRSMTSAEERILGMDENTGAHAGGTRRADASFACGRQANATTNMHSMQAASNGFAAQERELAVCWRDSSDVSQCNKQDVCSFVI